MSVAESKSKTVNWGLISFIFLLLVVLIWVGVRVALPDSPTILAGTQPTNIGITSGKLAACPTTPNCVNSQANDAEHQIEPLTYNSSPESAKSTLKEIIGDTERAKLVSESNNYLYAQFTSKWMGFVDDVEFYINEDAGVIDVRSASRLGESDLGVNRQRIEDIRTQFDLLQK